MKTLGLVFLTGFLLFTAEAFAQSYMMGMVSFEKNRVYFSSEGKKLPLTVANNQTLEVIKKLNTFDVISGYGLMDDKQALFETIEFVGLQKFLGLWQSGPTQLNVIDFNNAQLTHSTIALNLKYAITPGEKDSWTLFITDKNKVQLATLKLKYDSARIDIYDADTGRVKESLSLTRPSHPYAIPKN